MTLVSVLTGGLLIVLVAGDIVATVLHPTGRGPLCRLSNRGAWRVARGLSRATRSSQPMAFGGGLGMGATLAVWVGGLRSATP